MLSSGRRWRKSDTLLKALDKAMNAAYVIGDVYTVDHTWQSCVLVLCTTAHAQAQISPIRLVLYNE